MNRTPIQSDHYLKALIVVFSVYVGSFVYLELTTVKKEALLSEEGLYEVALEQISEEEKEQLRQELQADQATDLRSIARDANDSRPSSRDNWSTQSGSLGQGDPEQAARDFEAEVFAQTGGAATRERLLQESNKRIEQLKQQGKVTQANNSQTPGNSSYEGAVMVGFSVQNRTAFEGNTWYVRNPGYTCGFNAAGLVYLQIEVNAAGKVLAATFVPSKSKNASACMIEQALKYAKLSRFSSGAANASGWITYQFEAQ